MNLVSSLFAKIMSWFFLNLLLVAVALSVFFAFQPQVNLHAIFGQQGSNRLRTAGMLIAHDLNQKLQTNWTGVLSRHAKIHQVDFALILEDGHCFSSMGKNLPKAVLEKAKDALRRPPSPGRFPPPPGFEDPKRFPKNYIVDDGSASLRKDLMERKPRRHGDGLDRQPRFIMKTRHPTRYWTGILLPPDVSHPSAPALLLAVSDSVTGNGFFFDPLPWMIVAVAVILISVFFWIPMVRNITRPLTRMTRATEKIARGRFDVVLHEPRADEIGRLAKGINHMTARLSVFVKGQKRFLGDVAHELGSPIARIQFGLGALEQRVNRENRRRVVDVMEDIDHMSKLVNELLAFSRTQMNTQTVKLEKISLLPVVQAAVKRETTPVPEIIIKIDPEISVVASAELLTRALANLVRNAVKYAGDNGPIYVLAEKKKDTVSIEVRDKGPGVSEDFLDQLFEPFFRPEPSRDRDSGGVGLGLAIVKTCVETCRGKVTARNLKPRGFAVTILLKT
jgi:two-component system sensor histidine kinase CpxA